MKAVARLFPFLLLFSVPAFGAYAQYSSIARTETGTPLVGYTVTVYTVINNAVATIYFDVLGTVKVNPFVTDSSGSYSFYVNGDGLYFVGITAIPGTSVSWGYYDARYFSVSGSTVTPILVPGYRGGVGTTWYSGSGAPSSSLGVDGDYYLDTGTGNIYLRQGGSWGSPIMTLSGGGGGGGGSGTVTSITLALSSLPWLSLSGTNPITESGTITFAPTTGQTSHRVIGTCGSATVFGICQETAADISGLSASATTDTTNASNISSGTLADARLSAYSGVGACGTNLWASTLVRDGAPTCTQIGFSNLSGNPTTAQLASGTASSNTFLRGDLTWAALVAGNIPTLNQSTTGTAAGLSSTLVVAQGGTGGVSHTAYSLLTGGTTSTGALQSLASLGTLGQVLNSNGSSALPTWGGVTLAGLAGACVPGSGTDVITWNTSGTASCTVTPSGGGGVTGPGSSLANGLVTWSGTAGTALLSAGQPVLTNSGGVAKLTTSGGTTLIIGSTDTTYIQLMTNNITRWSVNPGSGNFEDGTGNSGTAAVIFNSGCPYSFTSDTTTCFGESAVGVPQIKAAGVEQEHWNSGGATIDVALNLPPQATPPFSCVSGKNGAIYYSSNLNMLCFCNGASWGPIIGGLGVC